MTYAPRKVARMGRRSRDKVGPYIPKLYIRDLRKEQDLSMVALLEKVAVHGAVLTEASLSRIERALQPVDTPTLYAIAKALGVPPTTLLTGIKPDPQGVDQLYEKLSPRDRAVVRRIMEDMAEGEPPPSRPRRRRPG